MMRFDRIKQGMRLGTPVRALASASALAILLAGCGASSPTEDRTAEGTAEVEGTADVWANTQVGVNDVQQAAVDRYNADATQKMNLVLIPATQNLNDKIRIAMGSSKPPDVFQNFGGGSIRDYVEAGLVTDLTPALDSNPQWRDAFLPSVLEAGQIDGEYYGIPFRGVQPVVLYYNKALFAEQGLEPPTTWDDLLSLVKAFSEKGITPLVVGGQDAWTELPYLEYLVDRIGGPQVFNAIASGESGAWSNPAVVRALQMIRDLVDAGAFGTNYPSVSYNDGSAGALFAQGRAAMQLQGTWEYTAQVGSAPDFATQDLGFVNFPSVPGGAGDEADVVGNPTNYFSVAKTDRAQAAIKFLEQMSTEEYVNGLIEIGEIPATVGIEDRFGDAPSPEFASAIYDMVRDAPSFTLSWDQALSSAEGTTVVTNLQQVFNGQISPEEFVAAMNDVE